MAALTHPGFRVSRLAATVIMLVMLTGCDWTPDSTRLPESSAETADQQSRFRSHMEVLAADDMQGRETGSEGYLRAARYVAAQFAEYGLVPLGSAGDYFQQVPFLSTRIDPDSASLEVRRGETVTQFVFGTDFVSSGGAEAGGSSVTAPLVFVGYGIRAPQHGHDDYAAVESAGKILVRLTGAPPGFPGDQRAYYSSGQVKDRFAVEQGAVGVITVRTPMDLPRLGWERYTASIGSSEMLWTGSDGVPFEAFPRLTGEAVLSEAGAAKLFEFSGRDLDALFRRAEAGESESFELGLEASLAKTSIQTRTAAPNVIGMITGSHPDPDGEIVLFTAHLDHLGIRYGASGAGIYNGAYDNAAGVAAILEVARMISGGGGRINRSVAFAALAGEEKGLQGSSYLAHNPPFPVGNIVAVINIDMPYLGFPIAEIMGLGAEHSSLEAAVRSAAKQAGLRYIADPRPELVRLIRSDQYSFVRRGIPGLNLKPGTASSDAAFDGAAMHESFLADHYHQPSDNLDLPFSEEGSRRFVHAALLLGLEVANADRRPHWNDNDFFGRIFAPGRSMVR